MPQVLLSFITQGPAPTPDEVEAELGLPQGALDRSFGVIEVDEITHEYTVRLEAGAAKKLRASPRLKVTGGFSDPSVEGF